MSATGATGAGESAYEVLIRPTTRTPLAAVASRRSVRVSTLVIVGQQRDRCRQTGRITGWRLR
jgi:hypothetical protein